MFRQRGLLRAVAASAPIAFAGWAAQTQCAVPFDAKDFPEKPASFFKNDNLSLVGVGMRRKNLVVLEVDVYLAALALSPSAVLSVKNWKKSKSNDALAEVILHQARDLKVAPSEDETNAAITLRFVRAVGKSQIVEAFSDAFKGVDAASITAFKEALAGAIPGESGLKVGDEFRFIWPKSGGLIVNSGNYTSKKVESSEIAKRLIEVYIEQSRTVSKELLQCVTDNIDKL